MRSRYSPFVGALLSALAALGTGCGSKPPPATVSAPAATPMPTPVTDSVVFIRSGALWVAHSDGGGARLLAVPGHDEDFWFPAIIPDGSGILVWLSRGDGTQDVARVGLSGRVSVLTDTGEQAQPPMKDLGVDNAPSCSPDGRQIAYSFNGNLWVMDSDGYNAQTLISDGASWSPAWSPDGKQIAYVNGREGHLDLWVTDLDSRDTYQVTDFSEYSVGGPRWSAGGDQILLTRTRGEENDIVEVPAKPDTPAADADTLTKDHQSASAVFLSSGGFLLSSARAGSGTWDLYTTDVLGTSARQITREGGLSPAWTRLALGASAVVPTATPRPARPKPSPTPETVPTLAVTPAATAVPSPPAAAPVPASPAASTAQPSPAPATGAPSAAARPAPNAAPLRLRFAASFDGKGKLDAPSRSRLTKLSRRVRQYAGDSLDVVGPLDTSALNGLYASEEARSMARAQAVGDALAHLAGVKSKQVKAEPYSPPAAGGEPNSILIYIELR